MFGHREVIICLYGSYFISVCTEAVKIYAKCLRIAAYVNDLINTVSAKHGYCFVVYTDTRRINNNDIGFFRDLIELLLDISADVMAI